MTDISLAEAVLILQRMDLAPETQQVVEEAGRLLQEGREIEARALVEKAEALAAQRSQNRNGSHAKESSDANPVDLIARIAEKLSAGFTETLAGVLEDVYQLAADQAHATGRALEDRICEIEARFVDLPRLEDRIEQIAEEHGSRIQAVEERVAVVDQVVRDLEPRFGSVLERVDRHTDTLLSLHEKHAQRVSALNHVLDSLSLLKEPEPAENVLAAIA